MSFISDLLVEISSFRIRIGNKLNALKTLIDGKANIDGLNIPYDTKWSHLKAGGLGDYYYIDTGLGSNFERVMVWDQGGWFWTNKSGMQTWLGIQDVGLHKTKVFNVAGSNISRVIPLFSLDNSSPSLNSYFYGKVYSKRNNNLSARTVGAEVVGSKMYSSEEAVVNVSFTTNSVLNFKPVTFFHNGIKWFGFNIITSTNSHIFVDGVASQWNDVVVLDYLSGSTVINQEINDSIEDYAFINDTYNKPEKSLFRLEAQAFIKNGGNGSNMLLDDGNVKPLSDFQNNYLESIITTNGTTAGTVYTFKRVGLSDLTLQLTPAGAQFSGVVTIGNQTFEGIKTFLKSPKVPNAVNADEAVNKGQLDTVAGSLGNYLEKATLNLSPAANWDTLAENRIVYSSSGANSPYNGYGIGFNFYTSNNFRSQLFFGTNTGANLSGGFIQYRVANNNGFTSVRTVWDNNNFNPAQYVMISALNATLANYGTLAGTQTWTGQNTYTQALIVPNGTLNGHAVNLGQLNDILDDYATEAWVTQQIANISIPNGQLTVNTTSDLVGGFVYLPNGNVTTTIGLSTAILNNIADGVTAYSYGDHAVQGYLKIADLNGYATQAWVNSQNFATQSQIITPNNGSFVVQGVGALTGAGSTSADSATNSVATLDLTASTKSQIAQGVSAYNEIPELRDGVMYHHVDVSVYNVPVVSKKTIINIAQDLQGGDVTVDDGRYDGDELAVNGCGEWQVKLVGEFQDACLNVGTVSITEAKRYWWVRDMERWVEA